ncbi:serine aminopeptidase domain-containing protein [Nocardia brasiliensis]
MNGHDGPPHGEAAEPAASTPHHGPRCSAWEQWSGEDVGTAVVTAPDGGRFRVTRLGAGNGQPVVLVPGMFDNRLVFLRADGGGLARVLARGGCDVWIAERRGRGGVPQARGVRAGWEEAMRCDLPALQQVVAETVHRPAFWVGHSFGGVLIARAVADTLDRARVCGVVLVDAAVDVPLLTSPILAAVARARWRQREFPARRLGLGPEDEPAAALADAIAWCAAERRRHAVTAALTTVDLPVLAFTGPHDFIAPPSRARALAHGFGSTDLRIQSAARRHGFGRDHTHESILLDPAADQDVFPFIRDWVNIRSVHPRPPALGEPADAPPRRHRLHLTLDLDSDPETVFDVLLDHWAALWPGLTRRVRDGIAPGDPNGLHAVRAHRALGIWPIQEHITAVRHPHHIEYRTIRGPVHRHRGRLHLTATRDGTRLDYRIEFDTRPTILGAILATALEHTWRHWSIPRLRALTSRS